MNQATRCDYIGCQEQWLYQIRRFDEAKKRTGEYAFRCLAHFLVYAKAEEDEAERMGKKS